MKSALPSPLFPLKRDQFSDAEDIICTKRKKHPGRKDFILQFFDLDVSKPNNLSMVLKTYSPSSWKVFQCGFELVAGTIGVFARLLPLVEIDSKCVFSIEVKGNNGSITDKFGLVPLTHRF